MRPARSLRAAVACAAFTVFSFSALAQPSQALWDARQLLEETRTAHVQLRAGGQVVDQIDRSNVEHAMRVVSRIADAYGVSPTPTVVIQSAKQPNAFATSRGGTPLVGINTAMLSMVGDNEDMLAVVMGHEFGHLQAHHTTEGVQRAQAITLIGAVLGAMVDINAAKHGRNTGGAGTLAAGLGAGLVNAKFSRDQEREADTLGIQAMARAGYDPDAAPDLWRLMESRGGGSSGLWLSSHPSNAEREHDLTVLAQGVRSVYLANRDKGASETVVATAAQPMTAAQEVSLAVQGRSIPEQPAPERPVGMTTAQEVALQVQGRLPADAQSRGVVELATAQASPAFATEPSLASASLADLAERAGDQDGAALGQLAWRYLKGEGGAQKDYGRARVYAERAQRLSAPLGQAIYGVLVRDGIAGSKDPARGTHWIAQAAQSGLAWARFELGVSYAQGLGVSADAARAQELLKGVQDDLPEAKQMLVQISQAR